MSLTLIGEWLKLQVIHCKINLLMVKYLVVLFVS